MIPSYFRSESKKTVYTIFPYASVFTTLLVVFQIRLLKARTYSAFPMHFIVHVLSAALISCKRVLHLRLCATLSTSCVQPDWWGPLSCAQKLPFPEICLYNAHASKSTLHMLKPQYRVWYAAYISNRSRMQFSGFSDAVSWEKSVVWIEIIVMLVYSR